MTNGSGGNENLIWDRMFQLDRSLDVSRGTKSVATPHDSNFTTNFSACIPQNCRWQHTSSMSLSASLTIARLKRYNTPWG
jgi:hypothetical protein